ncbi:N-D-ribosylpurine ribohydrolase [Tieghemostelium lacteum]|uniref:N-D-ribosylpurine ribohydrolase n=1 Tax=Tieghemostelium lacteum TaxID=361077 RepID=A0A151ZCT8_TIELA|nr:N-D-ribosylpurine ribohydrolase [Tieghemostelium lacteum]|eukprot:KYQ91767.1 N-D-ribosylpurine ribohydrolase [Tieghemostelium lacteum]
MQNIYNQELRYIWLDCDPGHDDAFMIMLATHTPGFKVLGISTVAGNQTVDKTTDNALRVLESIGLGGKIDVVKGAAVPLVRASMICPEIHGESGLDCITPLPHSKHSAITDKPAVQVMYERIKSCYHEQTKQQKVTIVATGCLTNIALLFSVYPQVKSMVDISILGGAINMGNMTPAAEFNILIDPEAAHIVFESGVQLTMVPLDVSHKALVTDQVVEQIRYIDKESRFIETCVNLLQFFKSTYRDLFNMPDAPLHDPLAMAYLINPNIFTVQQMRVDIETQGHCVGRTVCDVYNFEKKKPKNIHVATDVFVPAFWNLLVSALTRCNKSSCFNPSSSSSSSVGDIQTPPTNSPINSSSNGTNTQRDVVLEPVVLEPELTSQEIQELKTKIIRTSLIIGERWCPVNAIWYYKWAQTYYTRDDLGPIDNSMLLQADGETMKADLMSSKHYILVPEIIYKKLKAVYGGGPDIYRKVIKGRFESNFVDLKIPFPLQFVRSTDLTKVIDGYALSSETIASLKDRYCNVFGLVPSEVKIWDFYKNNKYHELKPLEYVGNSNLLDNQLILLEEKNADGTWPVIQRQNYATSSKLK